jgi:hypothetical protein
MVQPLTSCCDSEEPSLQVILHGMLTNIILIPTIKEEVIVAQRTGIGIGHIWRRLKLGEVKCFHEDIDGVLWFKNCLVVPKYFELRRKIMDESIALDILSIQEPIRCTRIWKTISDGLEWSKRSQGMWRSLTPIRVKANPLRPAGNLQPLSIREWKWEDICMDFIVGLSHTSCGYDSIWVIVDHLMKSDHFIPIGTRYRVRQYGELYISHIVCYHGISKTIISNRGSIFVAHF